MNSSGLVSFERFWGLCKRQLDMDYVYYIYFNSTRIRAICKIWGGFVNPFLRERLSNLPTHSLTPIVILKFLFQYLQKLVSKNFIEDLWVSYSTWEPGLILFISLIALLCFVSFFFSMFVIQYGRFAHQNSCLANRETQEDLFKFLMDLTSFGLSSPT